MKRCYIIKWRRTFWWRRHRLCKRHRWELCRLLTVTSRYEKQSVSGMANCDMKLNSLSIVCERSEEKLHSDIRRIDQKLDSIPTIRGKYRIFYFIVTLYLPQENNSAQSTKLRNVYWFSASALHSRKGCSAVHLLTYHVRARYNISRRTVVRANTN